MSYLTRKVVRNYAKHEGDLPPALLRLMDQLSSTHPSGITISAPYEKSAGCKFQIAIWAIPGASLQIGDAGSNESMTVTVSESTMTVKIIGSRGEAHEVNAPFSSEKIPGCNVPFHLVYISVYADWYGFGIALGDDTKELANEKFGGAFKPANRMHINGKRITYNENCIGVQIWCNNLEFKKIEYQEHGDYSFSIFERIVAACTFGEVWEEWTPGSPRVAFSDWPPVKHYVGAQPQSLVKSSRGADRLTHENNCFHWERPDGARNVYVWLCQSGQGGGGGHRYKAGTDGRNGTANFFKVDQDKLDLWIYTGGYGGSDGMAGDPGEHTTVDEYGWSSEGGAAETISGSLNLVNAQKKLPGGYFPNVKYGVKGVRCGFYPYGMVFGAIWRFCGGGAGGRADKDYPGSGGQGGSGVALFHYQY